MLLEVCRHLRGRRTKAPPENSGMLQSRDLHKQIIRMEIVIRTHRMIVYRLGTSLKYVESKSGQPARPTSSLLIPMLIFNRRGGEGPAGQTSGGYNCSGLDSKYYTHVPFFLNRATLRMVCLSSPMVLRTTLLISCMGTTSARPTSRQLKPWRTQLLLWLVKLPLGQLMV